jgi:hypothetical protein
MTRVLIWLIQQEHPLRKRRRKRNQSLRRKPERELFGENDKRRETWHS